MKILLLGKNGQLGQEIEKSAGELNWKTVSFSHQELDITDEEKIRINLEQIRPEAVINTSAYHVVPDCEVCPERAFEINCFALSKLAKITDELKITLVTYSTDYVFNGETKKPYREDDIPKPLQMYGLSKYAGELAALNYNLRTFVIRTCGLYGGKSGSKSKKGNFVLSILEAAKNKNSIEVADNQIVNPTYAADLARNTLNLLQKNAKPGLYHLANTGQCSWADFAEKIVEYAGFNNVTIKGVARNQDWGGVKRPEFSALANGKAEKISVVMPDWQDALRRYIGILSL